MASAALLAGVSGAKVLSVKDGNVSTLAEGPLQVVCTSSGHAGADEQFVFIAISTFSYPLVDQLIMKPSDRTYILPADGSGSSNFVMSIDANVSASDVLELETQLSRFASLRNRDGSLVATAPAREEHLIGDAVHAHTASSSALVPHDSAPHGTSPVDLVVGGLVAVGAAAGHYAPAVRQAVSTATPIVASAATSAANTAYAALPQQVKDIKAADVGHTTSSALLYASGLTKAALLTGSTHLGSGIKQVSSKLADALGQVPGPVHISPETRNRVAQAHAVSSAAVTVSGSLVMGAATVAKTLGTAAGSAFMHSEYGKKVGEASQTETGKAVRQIAASGLVAFGDVWDGLCGAAVILGADTGAATSGFVQKRYGAEAGQLAHESVSVAQDVGMAAMNVGSLGVGGMLRRTAVETAKDMVLRTGPGDQAQQLGHPVLMDMPGGAGARPAAPVMPNFAEQMMVTAALTAAGATPQQAGQIAAALPPGAGMQMAAAATQAAGAVQAAQAQAAPKR